MNLGAGLQVEQRVSDGHRHLLAHQHQRARHCPNGSEVDRDHYGVERDDEQDPIGNPDYEGCASQYERGIPSTFAAMKLVMRLLVTGRFC